MNDQLIIGDKASFDDYMASLARRFIGLPAKKTIKETIPFSNITYDFSKIDGELYWEERELEYVFEMLAQTPEELEELKAAFASWVMNVFEEEIHDPFIPDYHFVGTFDDIDFEDEETLDKTTATVKLKAYPFKVANIPTVFNLKSDGVGSKEWYIENNSSHAVRALFKLTFDNTDTLTKYVTFAINGIKAFKVDDGETVEVLMPSGTVRITGNNVPASQPYTCEITFQEEVF